ncbi:peptidoglycan-binding domain-containing protein [Methylobacterium durans]|uniref:peptidoglycan-binding domain-containing protein n=1 Tax=Methylobacterium durans TaxID=2202825 RepID=UPI002AFEF76D|nr:peptidoglycan-binding domain-containing protein [Methylobacterium durans]MEA1831332.1 peptidoglycan-binding domain-containing protein [Methylobacterium durans]
MRDSPRPRDTREIIVAGETRPPAGARRRAGSPPPPGEMRAALSAFARGLGGLCRRHPGEMAGSLAAIAAAAYVAVNALGLQQGRHPAPILPKVATRAEAPAKRAAPAEKPAPDKALAAAETPKEAPRAAAKAAEVAPKRDPIGDLIRSDETTTASVSPKADAKADRSVMQAQRALLKLGYGPLKADGMMGTNTRAAIEKFERDRKLPVKGEAAGRTLRELAARSGLPPG